MKAGTGGLQLTTTFMSAVLNTGPRDKLRTSVCSSGVVKLLSISSQSKLKFIKFNGHDFIKFTIFTTSSNIDFSAFGIIFTASG
jgi:hypothetical protein